MPENVAPLPDAEKVASHDVPSSTVAKGEVAPSVATSPEAQAALRQDAVTVSQVPGQEVSPSASLNQPAPAPANAGKQVQPLGVPVGSKKEQVLTSPGSHVSNPKRWERIDLNVHESADGEYHTIKKHVAKDFVFLQNRLDTETWLKRVSTFVDDRQAHAAVHMVLDNKSDEIAKWLANPKSPTDFGFSFSPPAGNREYAPTGLILERKTSRFISGSGGKVYLRKDQSMPNGFRIITSYPIP